MLGLADATHIFDGLASFPTHIAHMRLGTFVSPPIPWHPPSPSSFSTSSTKKHHPPSPESTLHGVALCWLKVDRAHRRRLEEGGGRRARGARKGEEAMRVTDSETFFRK